MSMTATAPHPHVARPRKDGLIGLWGRLIHRDPAAYEHWLEERDMLIITANLLRLKERQLNRIGLSRATLALDVEDLAQRAQRDAQLTSDVLQIVETDSARSRHAIAAE